MSIFAISFRIHEDSTYEARYESLVEEIKKEAIGGTWEETTSFFLIENTKTSQSLCDDLYNNSKIIETKIFCSSSIFLQKSTLSAVLHIQIL
jgi:hypothetical protein